MHFTFWASSKANEGGHTEVSWQELVRFVSEPQIAPTKEALEGWSPVRFRDNRRAVAAVELVSAIVLDVDYGHLPLDALVERFRDGLKIRSLLHTSFSHTPEHPKFRIILACSRDMTRDEHAIVWRHICRLVKVQDIYIDEATKDAGRLWFVPAHHEGAPYEWCEITGQSLDVDAILAMPPTMVDAPVPSPSASPPNARRKALALALGTSWPEKGNGRHEAQLALAGALRTAGFTADETVEFLRDVCRVAGDEDPVKRQQTVDHTYAQPPGAPLTGWTRLKSHVDPVIVEAVRGACNKDAEFSERTERRLAAAVRANFYRAA